jgi:hypothetical protein
MRLQHEPESSFLEHSLNNIPATLSAISEEKGNVSIKISRRWIKGIREDET